MEDVGADESTKEIAKVINAEHSRAYGKALRAARSMGDNEAAAFQYLWLHNVLRVF